MYKRSRKILLLPNRIRYYHTNVHTIQYIGGIFTDQYDTYFVKSFLLLLGKGGWKPRLVCLVIVLQHTNSRVIAVPLSPPAPSEAVVLRMMYMCCAILVVILEFCGASMCLYVLDAPWHQLRAIDLGLGSKIFKLGIWLVGSTAASQSEARLENPCYLTWN